MRKVRDNRRPEIPDLVKSKWRELITICWEHYPLRRPTFKQIVTAMRGPDFMDQGFDVGVVMAYQQRTLAAESEFTVSRLADDAALERVIDEDTDYAYYELSDMD
jgi:hypothetical protein